MLIKIRFTLIPLALAAEKLFPQALILKPKVVKVRINQMITTSVKKTIKGIKYVMSPTLKVKVLAISSDPPP